MSGRTGRPPQRHDGRGASPQHRKPQAIAKPQAKPRESLRRRFFGRWGEPILVMLFLFLIMYLTFWPMRYEGSAMEPAIMSGDRIMVSRLAAQFGFISHGDIVIYRYRYQDALGNERETTTIARVIGLPQDVITIDGGLVFRNGERIDEPYLPLGITTHPASEPIQIPHFHYFVLVDNRFAGGDSREFGLVERSDVRARAVMRVENLR